MEWSRFVQLGSLAVWQDNAVSDLPSCSFADTVVGEIGRHQTPAHDQTALRGNHTTFGTASTSGNVGMTDMDEATKRSRTC